MVRRYRELDALAVLTEQDRAAYERAHERDRAADVAAAEHGPRDRAAAADLSAKRIFAAGRYTPQKGYDYLIDAFAPVARAHPDWELKICGHGRTQDAPAGADRPRRASATRRPSRARPTTSRARWRRRRSTRSRSRFEGFPLVLVEAMSKGMAVRGVRLPDGPRGHHRRPPQRAAGPGQGRRGPDGGADGDDRGRGAAAPLRRRGARDRPRLHDGRDRPQVGRDAASAPARARPARG